MHAKIVNFAKKLKFVRTGGSPYSKEFLRIFSILQKN
jgi:hypothetical protein